MDTNWTLTEFDLTKLVFRRHASLREIATLIAIVTVLVPIGIGIVVFALIVYEACWNDWFGRAGPWLAGLIIFACATWKVATMINHFKESRGLQAIADVTDQYSLNDILADQLDPIGQVAGVSARDVLQATNTMLSGLSSEQATPRERCPDRRIVSGLLRIILCILIVIIALMIVAYSVHMVEPSSPALSPFLIFLPRNSTGGPDFEILG